MLKRVPFKANKDHGGYLKCCVCKYGNKHQKHIKCIDLFGSDCGL